MPRPQKPGEDKRDYSIEIRVTFAEKTQLQNTAKDSGLTVSDYFRKLAFNAKSLRPVPTADREALLRHLAESNKQGSNLNQIAKVLNFKSEHEALSPVLIEMVERALAKYEQSTDALMELLSW